MPVEAKEKPILFSGPMIRAILDGRKCQTRRVVKPKHPNGVITGPSAEPNGAIESWGGGGWGVKGRTPVGVEVRDCPYGKPGDHLWVRETAEAYHIPHLLTGEPTEAVGARYVADGEPVLTQYGNLDIAWWYSRPTCPAIHMFHNYSRITLEVTDVRVQRLQDISEEDARAEGISAESASQFVGHGHPLDDTAWIIAYADLWNHINGKKYPWKSNVWVWAISFKRVK
jgi:hypothetical protein